MKILKNHLLPSLDMLARLPGSSGGVVGQTKQWKSQGHANTDL